VGIERYARPAVAEPMPDNEIGRRNHANRPDGVGRHRMGFYWQSHPFQQGPDPLRMCRAITRRIVGGNLDYFGQKVALGGEASVDDLADLCFESGCHDGTGKFNRKSLKA
jgi:hypothetical protein